MSEPTISVVIPLYNKQLEIGTAVRSVLALSLIHISEPTRP